MIAQIHIKEGVVIDGLRSVMWSAAAKMAEIFARYGKAFVITSGLEGEHMTGSLHYKGLAIDIRSRDVGSRSAKLKILAEMKAAVGPAYQCFLEATHYHVEFDPK